MPSTAERIKCNKVKNRLRPYFVNCILCRLRALLLSVIGPMNFCKNLKETCATKNCNRVIAITKLQEWRLRHSSKGLYNKNLSEWILKLLKLSKLNLELRDIRDVEKKLIFLSFSESLWKSKYINYISWIRKKSTKCS